VRADAIAALASRGWFTERTRPDDRRA
jgi:hypothetical protein